MSTKVRRQELLVEARRKRNAWVEAARDGGRSGGRVAGAALQNGSGAPFFLLLKTKNRTYQSQLKLSAKIQQWNSSWTGGPPFDPHTKC